MNQLLPSTNEERRFGEEEDAGKNDEKGPANTGQKLIAAQCTVGWASKAGGLAVGDGQSEVAGCCPGWIPPGRRLSARLCQENINLFTGP